MIKDSLIGKLEAAAIGDGPMALRTLDMYDIRRIIEEHTTAPENVCIVCEKPRSQCERQSEISVVDEIELKETIRKVVSLVCNTQQAAVKGMIDMIWLKIRPYLRIKDSNPSVWNWSNTNNGSLWGTPRTTEPVSIEEAAKAIGEFQDVDSHWKWDSLSCIEKDYWRLRATTVARAWELPYVE